MTEFLDGAKTTVRIVNLVHKSNKVQMAVAFWGDGATEGLGGKAATVICNLKSGGTNPDEIRKLRKANINVLQCDNLHGKVYLFDGCVIIGSSNVSSNGLALQGNELSGWKEANVLSDDRNVCNDAITWFNELSPPPIDDPDLEAAQFKRRRGAVPDSWPENATLVEALKHRPENFKDKEIYLCAFKCYLDNDVIDAFKEGLEKDEIEQEDQLDCFDVSVTVPQSAHLVCFYVGPPNEMFYGFRKTFPNGKDRNARNTTVKPVRIEEKLNGISDVGSLEEWIRALRAFHKDEIGNSQSLEGSCMQLWKFYEKYLSPRLESLEIVQPDTL